MKATEQTLQQVQRFIGKIADKFPPKKDTTLLTDIHLRANQETGDLVAFDDDDNEITRVVVEQWIDNGDDDFYDEIAKTLRRCIDKKRPVVEAMSILKPFSFVLEDEDKESMAELYLVDDDTAIADTDLLKGLDKDLDDFLDKLLKE